MTKVLRVDGSQWLFTHDERCIVPVRDTVSTLWQSWKCQPRPGSLS